MHSIRVKSSEMHRLLRWSVEPFLQSGVGIDGIIMQYRLVKRIQMYTDSHPILFQGGGGELLNSNFLNEPGYSYLLAFSKADETEFQAAGPVSLD